jgi:two-component system chemotaxis sensor kinase CheA
VSDFPISPELVAIYLEDARTHLEALDGCLLSLERDGMDGEAVSGVLGPLHTLKGNSGMMGFASIKDYVHRLEDVFARLGEGALGLGPALFEPLFAGASALRDAVERACKEPPELRDLAPERRELEALLDAPPPAPPAGPGPAAPRPAAPQPTTMPAAPAPAAPPPEPAPPADPEGRSNRPVDAQYVSTRSNMVRVDFAQLDQLLNLVGELIIYRTKLDAQGRSLAEATANRDAARELLAAVHQVAQVSTRLQETVMDIRMLPIRHVFERFPRLVRDLSKRQGKDIELLLEGVETRIDKAIIDEIGEPLVHMVRNAVDHGIELPEVRQARGKNRTGTLLLSAAQESNHVVLTIMDDGGGIDPQAVRRKAVARGLIKPEEQLAERDLINLIFSQGFSTAEAITDVSGRGVGLDVVLKSIERLNGLVEIETMPGVGTKFVIQLPLTLAIISALLVEVGSHAYAVPLGSVVESLCLDSVQIHRIGGVEALRIRDLIVPLVRLGSFLGLPGPSGSGREYAVVLGRGEKRVGLVVDRLRGQQEIVIKALDRAVAAPGQGIAGATIMGDGRVVLIVDVAAFFETRKGATRAHEARAS